MPKLGQAKLETTYSFCLCPSDKRVSRVGVQWKLYTVPSFPRSYTGAYLKEILARSDRGKGGPAMKFSKARVRVSKREATAAE